MSGAALVTASGRRLGRAMALALAERGYDLAIHYQSSQAEAEQTCSDIKALGRKAFALQADLGEEAATQALVPRAAAALGQPLSILINNASLFERDEALDAEKALWDRHMAINLRAPFVLSQALAKGLAAADEGGEGASTAAPPRGLIVNMLDTRVLNLTPHFSSYTLSKAGLYTLTQTLALALAPSVRVNGIAPGFTLPSPGQSQAQFDERAARQPLGQPVDPRDIVAALLCLLDAPSLTGQVIAPDAGQHLNWRP